MTGPAWTAWVVTLPLAGALLSVLLGRRASRLWVALSPVVVVAAASVAARVLAVGTYRHEVGGWGAPLGVDLVVDGAGALMLVTFASVATLVGGYAALSPGRDQRGAFFGLAFFAWGALNALVISADAFNLYVSLELVTLAAVALIALEGDRGALASALRYLVLAILGSLAYLAGVALLYAEHATLDLAMLGAREQRDPLGNTAVALLTVGLALKSGAFPLHAWLPPAYARASPPVAAFLSGLVSKAAFFVLFRVYFAVLATPGHSLATGQWLGAMGGGGAIWASLLALRQRRLKLVLAYSSVSQVGYLLLVFALASTTARDATMLLAASHAAASAAMFTAAGVVEDAIGTDRIDSLKGVALHHPRTFFALGLGGISLIGLPPSGGFVAKWLLLRTAFELGQWWWAALVLFGSLISAGYVFRILRVAFHAPPVAIRVRPVSRGRELLSLSLSALAVALGVAPALPLSLLEGGRA